MAIEEVSHVIRHITCESVREFGGTRSHKGRARPCYRPIRGVRSRRGRGCQGT